MSSSRRADEDTEGDGYIGGERRDIHVAIISCHGMGVLSRSIRKAPLARRSGRTAVETGATFEPCRVNRTREDDRDCPTPTSDVLDVMDDQDELIFRVVVTKTEFSASISIARLKR